MTESAKKRVGFSMGRVTTIAGNTFIEAVRQKVFNILLIFGLVVIACALFFRQFDFGEEFKFVKDFCLGAISIFGTCIAIVGTSMLLPNEVEHRTIYTILSKPVRRFEFLLGKYLGSVQLLLTSTVLMSLMFAAVMYVMMMVSQNRVLHEAGQNEGAVPTEVQQQIKQIHAAALDPDIVKGILLIFIKLCVMAGVTLLVSTFSTSMVFNVVVSFMVFIAGHLVSTATEMWGHHAVAKWLLAIVPDLGAFNVADDIILGNAIPWSHVGSVSLYGLVYTAAVVAAAHFIFEGREI
jgi:ABC-type transport system involved in multi-copper enzyme maturation permease subunit